MIDFKYKIKLAKEYFQEWSMEQDKTAPNFPILSEIFFSSHLYGELTELQSYPSIDIGEYVKEFMRYVNDELEGIYEAEEQRILSSREKVYN